MQTLPDALVARVALELPLRANLTARENIALIPLYQKDQNATQAAQQAQALLDELGFGAIGTKRDPDMTPSERFAAKLARALILKRPRLVIEQPGAMLYDVHYPALLKTLAGCFDASQKNPSTAQKWEIFDYTWNQLLYNN